MTGNETSGQSQTAEHWCKEHNTAFFMRGKMKSYAHPIGDTGEWCHEHKEKVAPKAELKLAQKDTDSEEDRDKMKREETPKSPALELKRDSETIKTIAELQKALFEDFHMQPKEQLAELNLKSWNELAIKPSEAYIQIVAIRR